MKNEMTLAEKLKILDDTVAAYKKLDELCGQFAKLTGCAYDGPMFDALWKAVDLAHVYAAQLVGDDSEWLQWFIHENGCGERGLSCGLKSGRMRKIKTTADLLWIIEAKQENR